MKRFSKTVRKARAARDTLALAVRVVLRRLRETGPFGLIGLRAPANLPVVYLDAGLHHTAHQLQLVREWFGERCLLRLYGFEAHPANAERVQAKIGHLPKTVLVNAAVVGPAQGETVTLYLDGRFGAGDSLIRLGSGRSIEVPAVRLSRYLRDVGLDGDKAVLILRMNIEGAELFVLEDLLQEGLISTFDGFYGSWSDPKKIGGETARRFASVKAAAGVENIRFNDQDCRSRLRLALIRYDLVTSIDAGARRKGLG